MATSYDVVENRFLMRIQDDYLDSLTDQDLEDLLDYLLFSANVRFKAKCKQDLTDRNDTAREYNVDLTDDVIDILSVAMVVEWNDRYLQNVELQKQLMTDKDYKIYSQANHIDKVIDSIKMVENKLKSMIISYTYSENSLEDLN